MRFLKSQPNYLTVPRIGLRNRNLKTKHKAYTIDQTETVGRNPYNY